MSRGLGDVYKRQTKWSSTERDLQLTTIMMNLSRYQRMQRNLQETKNHNTGQPIHATVIFPQKPCTWTRSCSTCFRRLSRVATLMLSRTSPATTPATLSLSSQYGNTQHLRTAPDVLPQWKQWRICSSRVMDPSGSWILYEQYEKCMTQD